MIELHNTIHNTKVRIRAHLGQTLTPAQVRRIRRELCGVRGCTCGVVRDPDHVLIQVGWDVHADEVQLAIEETKA